MPKTIARPNLFASRKKPMGDMNVTPFIDVLLVLIIMLIMVVPVAKHVTEVDLPSGPGLEVERENTVFIDSKDQLFWNGKATNRDQLRTTIENASAMEDQPLLRFEPHANASYDQSARTIALIKDSGAEKFAFIGNALHKDFGR